jgi:Methyltransferase domain
MYTIDKYWSEGFPNIEGWVDPGMIHVLKELARIQAGLGIRGGMLEIGVHHGRLLIPLALLTGPGEHTVGVDVFDRQDLNLDKSGCGDQSVTRKNVRKYCGPTRKVSLIKMDSMAINIAVRVSLVEKYGPFRIISIDGGHTVEHTVNDLNIAEDVLQSGGVVLVDDYYNMDYPGVHEGVVRFFASQPRKLRPFAYTQNKLLISDAAHAMRYYEAFATAFAKEKHFNRVSMQGAPVVIFLTH